MRPGCWLSCCWPRSFFPDPAGPVDDRPIPFKRVPAVLCYKTDQPAIGGLETRLDTDTTRYELPLGGTTLLGYVVRRMHKTHLLEAAVESVYAGRKPEALRSVALYTAISTTSYGRAYYQPEFDSQGDKASEEDPATGAKVSAELVNSTPHYQISCTVQQDGRYEYLAEETITGTTFGLRGLGMPAPSRFIFTCGEYRAELSGVITSELAVSLLRPTLIRAFGDLAGSDNAGNQVLMELNRKGEIQVDLNRERGQYLFSELVEAAGGQGKADE